MDVFVAGIGKGDAGYVDIPAAIDPEALSSVIVHPVVNRFPERICLFSSIVFDRYHVGSNANGSVPGDQHVAGCIHLNNCPAVSTTAGRSTPLTPDRRPVKTVFLGQDIEIRGDFPFG